jgi:hypothetical protein
MRIGFYYSVHKILYILYIEFLFRSIPSAAYYRLVAYIPVALQVYTTESRGLEF